MFFTEVNGTIWWGCNFVKSTVSSVISIDFDKTVIEGNLCRLVIFDYFVVIFDFTENDIFDVIIDIFVVLNVILVDLIDYFVDFDDFLVILNG